MAAVQLESDVRLYSADIAPVTTVPGKNLKFTAITAAVLTVYRGKANDNSGAIAVLWQ